ncbi:MAG: 3-phosphoshikimate 1-carboxyvinyltransferase [Candidatus Aadella gelida]|nr:3-phosphoshikimate 1-carboxyvinyltransferase [Candidatus Aadella gelida]
MDWKIGKAEKGLRGEIVVPADKSISHRAIMFASIANGECRINNFLSSDDCMCTLVAFQKMGIGIQKENESVIVKGQGLKGLKVPAGPLYMGNSGTSMRIISGILAGQDFDVTLTGDESLSSRPMERILDPLRNMGARIESQNGYPPLEIKAAKSKLDPISYKTSVASAQVKSCILSAGLYADGETSVTEPFSSRDHTERMLHNFSADINHEKLTTKITGGKELISRDVNVPGDISSAAFLIVGALLVPNSKLILKKVGLNPTRAGILTVLDRMSRGITILDHKYDREDGREPYGDIQIESSELQGTIVNAEEIPSLIDEVPILMLAGCMAEGDTEIRGISELKVKESNRVKTMTDNLGRMGVDVIEEKDSIFFRGGAKRFSPAALDSFGDHRIAMTMAVAALLSGGECTIKDTKCADTSYPGFMEDLKSVVSA